MTPPPFFFRGEPMHVIQRYRTKLWVLYLFLGHVVLQAVRRQKKLVGDFFGVKQMGYYMTVERQELKANGLTQLPDGIDEFWALEDEHVSITEGYFKWGDWFEDDLKTLARAGVTGEIELSGEQAEWQKYVLKDGVVELYEGAIVYPNKPTEVI